jgi:hypothetical protein
MQSNKDHAAAFRACWTSQVCHIREGRRFLSLMWDIAKSRLWHVCCGTFMGKFGGEQGKDKGGELQWNATQR